MQVLFRLDELKRALIVKRPSAVCKSPYVADGFIVGDDNETRECDSGDAEQLHCPSLGCCGLSNKDSLVYVSHMPIKNKNKLLVCKHRVELSIIKTNSEGGELICGINPKLAERIVDNCISMNCLKQLNNVREYRREVKHLKSRFDFSGIDSDGNTFYLEVKNVPLADFVDCSKADRKMVDTSHFSFNDKIAYFPDGYRKKPTDVISPRALKHIEELQYIVENEKSRGIMCYVIQRTDVSSFQPSNLDKIYQDSVRRAMVAGVEIIFIVCEWKRDGSCVFIRDDLPINIF